MFKQKQAKNLELICASCGKPIASKARTNVTRYLFKQSRCQCISPSLNNEPANDSHSLLLADANTAQQNPEQHFQPAIEDKAEYSVVDNIPDYYQVLSLIGEGGMGTIYKVLDTRLNKNFAIKVLRLQLIKDKTALERFKQEAHAASTLNHPNLATIYSYDIGKHNAPFIVMDYCEGDNLAQIIEKEQCIDVPTAIDLFIDIADALEHAHDKGVIHRDVKPTNIVIEQRNGAIIPKLVDFGIAKLLPREGLHTQSLTTTGDIFGSPLYMSPEQGLGSDLDARSDIYTMGCVMYECLSGKPPFKGINPIKTILMHINEKPPELRALVTQQEIPSDLQYIVMRCLEKKAADRYQTMNALKSDLNSFVEGRSIKRVKVARQENSTTIKQLIAFAAVVILLYELSANSMLQALVNHSKPDKPNVIFTSPNSNITPTKVSVNPDADALSMDGLSYSYFMAGQYDKAIPLLEFAEKAFRQSKKPDTLLADQLQHLGKCYKMLGQYDKAIPYYQEAYDIYCKYGIYKGGLMPECIVDYADVLRKTGKPDLANNIEQRWNIK